MCVCKQEGKQSLSGELASEPTSLLLVPTHLQGTPVSHTSSSKRGLWMPVPILAALLGYLMDVGQSLFSLLDSQLKQLS